jgi:hypothetical protein
MSITSEIDKLSTTLRTLRHRAVQLFIDIALNGREKSIKGDGLCLQRAIIESLDPHLYSEPKNADDLRRSLDDALKFRRNSLHQLGKSVVKVMDDREPKFLSLDQFCHTIPGSKSNYYFSEQEHVAAAVNLINGVGIILVDREDEQLIFQIIFPEGTKAEAIPTKAKDIKVLIIFTIQPLLVYDSLTFRSLLI